MPIDSTEPGKPGHMHLSVGMEQALYYDLVEEARSSGKPWIQVVREGLADHVKRQKEGRELKTDTKEQEKPSK